MHKEHTLNRDVHITHDLSRRADWVRHDRIRFHEGDLYASPYMEIRYNETRGV